MRKVQIFLAVICFALLSSTVSAAPELTRTQAAEMILNSAEFSKTRDFLLFYKGAYEKGIENGLWKGVDSETRTLLMTPLGARLFQEIKAVGFISYEIHATPFSPIEIVASMTGITQAPSRLGQASIAQFTWRYVDLPLEVRRYVVDGGSGEALIRMYDDGWRLEKLNFDYSDQPALSPQEKVQVEEEEKKAQDRAQALIAISRQRGEEILSVAWEMDRGIYGITDYRLVVTDIDVWFSNKIRSWYSVRQLFTAELIERATF